MQEIGTFEAKNQLNAFLLPDETTPTTQTLLTTIVTTGAWVPAHWRLEVANALNTAIRRPRPLTTLDNDLKTAATTAGIPLQIP
jgi:hypothetical protein